MIALSLIALVWALWKIHVLRLKIWALTQQRDEARVQVKRLTVAMRRRPEPGRIAADEADTFRKSKRLDQSRRRPPRYGTAGEVGAG